ncbi:MAG: DUF4012 domain-containing protein, partial [Candidatus Gracilibacteria bacterium]|nr:DUF4012 domain-containing protein [Candidatus Gracilibacteria bacterium]
TRIGEDGAAGSMPGASTKNWKSYYTIFAIALCFVFFVNAISIVQKLFNVKSDVTYAVQQGYNEFLANINERNDFSKARQYFLDAKVEMETIIGDGKFLNDNTLLDTVANMIQIGVELTDGAELTLKVEDMLLSNFKNLSGEKKLGEIEATLDDAIAHVENAVNLFEKISLNSLKVQLSKENYAHILTLKDQVTKLDQTLKEIKNNIHPLFKFLGVRYPNKVLVLLQNNNEIRPTGGFIGSLGFIDLNDGRIENIQVRDVYDFDGQAFDRMPNSEISIVSGQDWGIRDSNTSPDFEISARQAKRFLEEAKGPGVDSVVAIDLEFMRSILKKTGPIEIEEFALTLDAENFDIILSYIIESKTFGKNSPKEILKYFLADLEAQVFEKLDPLELVALIADGVNERHVQMYSDDSDIQEWFKELGAAGHLSSAAPYNDYLNVIDISVGGNKSDMFMWQAIKHESFIKKDGAITNQLTVKRTHTWNNDVENFVHDQLRTAGVFEPHPEMMRILGKDTNKVMVRAYIPYGSQLKTVIGVPKEEIRTMMDEVITYDNNGKTTRKLTYFLFPMDTVIGGTKEVVLTYDLPFKLNFDPLDDYRLFFDKQAGLKSVDFEKYIYYANGLRSYVTNPEFTESEDGELYRAVLRTDRMVGAAIGEE